MPGGGRARSRRQRQAGSRPRNRRRRGEESRRRSHRERRAERKKLGDDTPAPSGGFESEAFVASWWWEGDKIYSIRFAPFGGSRRARAEVARGPKFRVRDSTIEP